ncbi:MAG TPA: hypothetical protein VJ831_02020 [Jatrophihabitantaceae bacterium]|nr:hypothetical protein [Jatrophihabitantaceae bacterium]
MAATSFEAARDELYGLDPEQFMSRRGELAKAARDGGDDAAAKQIGGLRKPNRSAYAVNALVRAKPRAVDRLAELGGRLLDAQDNLDGVLMRELSTERNKLVDELAREAFRAVAVTTPTAALRDDVVNTLNAAIADSDVLERLREGALVRPESWSGFGATLAPSLHVVKGAKADRPVRQSEPARERREARMSVASDAVAEARAELETAEAEVKEQEKRLRRLEAEVKEARRRVDDARLDAKHATTRLDKARAALNRLSN